MGNNKSILIIDDDVNFSKMAGMILEEKGGYKVKVCNQSEKAIEVVRSVQPDLILLDIVMPNVDGPEICAQLQQDPQLKKIQIVFLTSLITPEEAAAHPVIAKHKFIGKPIRGDELLKKVNGFCGIGN